jgi:phosphoenolpyruvate synthase/pyruvate phosphate dikinase
MHRFHLLQGPPSEVAPGEVGPKAHTLAVLSEFGVQVPEGFGIPATVSLQAWASLPAAWLGEHSAGGVDAHALQSAYPEADLQELRRRLDHYDAPYGFAVRSSGRSEDGSHRSFAGVYDSLLGVPAEDVVGAVALVWASETSARARAYAGSDLLLQPQGMGVIVQRMINPRVAGTVFTTNPVDATSDSVVVEAVFGLADGLMAGVVQPDAYEVTRAGVEIEALVSHQETKQELLAGGGVTDVPLTSSEQDSRKLTPAELGELVELALKIEAKLGGAQDIEFAIDDSGINILQARPVTAIATRTDNERRRA